MTTRGTLRGGTSITYTMRKPWIAITFPALASGFWTLANTRRVLTSPTAIHGVPQNSNLSAEETNGTTSGVTHTTLFPVPGWDSTQATCFEYGIDYPGSDIKKLEDGSVRHPKACEQMCTQTAGCEYWTYVPKTFACYLKSKAARQVRTCRSSAISGSRVCSSPHESCYEIDTDYHGYDERKFVNHLVRSAKECHMACLAFPRCHFWTWVSSQRNCYLKNERARRGRVHAAGSISGPRHCIAGFRQPPAERASYGCDKQNRYEDSCYDHNVVYNEANVEIHATARGPRECQHLCQQHPACRGFSFLPLKNLCMLMRITGLPFPSENAISGPKYCYTPECAIKDVIYYGKILQTSATPSFAVCHKQCQIDHRCSAVTYEKASRGCMLIQGAAKAPGLVSGPKWCMGPGRQRTGRQQSGNTATSDATAVQHVDSLGGSFCYDLASAYRSVPASSKHLDSAEECQRQCRAQPRCKFFTYFLYGKTCLLHEAEGQRVPNETAVSGPSVCPPSSCFYIDVEVFGKDIGRRTADDAAACQTFCQQNELCSFFVYDASSRICLKRQNRGYRSGTISAPVFCGVPDDDITVHQVMQGHSQLENIRSDKPHSQHKHDGALLDKGQGENIKAARKCNAVMPDAHSAESGSSHPRSHDLHDTKSEGSEDLTSPEADLLHVISDGDGRSTSLDVKPEKGRGDNSGPTRKHDVIKSAVLFGESVSPPESGPDLPDTDPWKDQRPISPRVSLLDVFSDGSGRLASLDAVKSDEGQGENSGIARKHDVVTSDKNLNEGVGLLAPDHRLPDASREENMRPPSAHVGLFDTTSDRYGKSASLDDDKPKIHQHKRERSPQLLGTDMADGDHKRSLASDCLTIGSYYDSLAIEDIVVESTEECQRKCQQEQLCNFFSFFRDSARCTLHLVAGNKMLKREAVSGPWKCDAKPRTGNCLVLGEYLGKRLNGDGLPSTSVTECYLLCVAHQPCKFFTYDGSQFMCRLFERVYTLRKAVMSVSGPRDCGTTEASPCFENGIRCEGQISKARTVNSAQDCLNTCQEDVSCNFYSYDTVTNLCSLLTDNRKDTRDDSAVCGAKHCFSLSFDPSCFHVDTIYTSGSRALPARSFPECYNLCEKGKTCRFFSFIGEENMCHLHEVGTSVVSRQGAIGGARHCSASYHAEHCLMKSSRYVGEIAETLDEVDTTSECQMECSANAQCRFFSHAPDTKTCVLFKNRTFLLPDMRTVSGWRQCPGAGECATDAEVDVENYSLFIFETSDFDTCNAYCLQIDECSVAAYDPSTKKCHLAALFEVVPGVVSGPVSCNAKTSVMWSSLWGGQKPQESVVSAEFCFQENTRYTGTPMKQASADSAPGCQLLCQGHPKCRFFSYCRTKRTCHFYETNKSSRVQADYVSAPAWCNPPPITCTVENLVINGQATMERETQTAEACAATCRESSGYTYFTFDTLTGRCTCGVHPKPATKRETAFRACIRYKGSGGLPRLEASVQTPTGRVPYKCMGYGGMSRCNPAGKKRLLFHQRIAKYFTESED